MTAGIVRFASKAQLLHREKARQLRQLALEFEAEAPKAVGQIVAVIDRNTAAAKAWSFVMMGPAQHLAVVLWISDHAKRPKLSNKLWAHFWCHLRTDTGEIVMSRAEMAEAVGATPRDVSTALTELHKFGALIRHQEGREVRWFMNSQVGTKLTGAARERAQRRDPPILTTIKGGAASR